MEEVKLISWPTPKSAILNTFLVIVIVAGTSAVLFGVNTLLAEASRVVYTKF
jgi:preprotein translocase SecE subunit